MLVIYSGTSLNEHHLSGEFRSEDNVNSPPKLKHWSCVYTRWIKLFTFMKKPWRRHFESAQLRVSQHPYGSGKWVSDSASIREFQVDELVSIQQGVPSGRVDIAPKPTPGTSKFWFIVLVVTFGLRFCGTYTGNLLCMWCCLKKLTRMECRGTHSRILPLYRMMLVRQGTRTRITVLIKKSE